MGTEKSQQGTASQQDGESREKGRGCEDGPPRGMKKMREMMADCGCAPGMMEMMASCCGKPDQSGTEKPEQPGSEESA